MTGGGDAILETDRAKRKREARDAFEQKTASDALDFDLRSILAIPEPERTEDMATLLRKQADVVDVIVSNSEKRNSRRRKITWFYPPFSKNVNTNVEENFLKLIEKCFPKNHPLNKIINKNTIKISYKCKNKCRRKFPQTY